MGQETLDALMGNPLIIKYLKLDNIEGENTDTQIYYLIQALKEALDEHPRDVGLDGLYRTLQDEYPTHFKINKLGG